MSKARGPTVAGAPGAWYPELSHEAQQINANMRKHTDANMAWYINLVHRLQPQDLGRTNERTEVSTRWALGSAIEQSEKDPMRRNAGRQGQGKDKMQAGRNQDGQCC